MHFWQKLKEMPFSSHEHPKVSSFNFEYWEERVEECEFGNGMNSLLIGESRCIAGVFSPTS
jgi:hypothetical protein